ncbi:hypothetical protein BVC80_989g46 [Macleaya cordata]|uniref:Uncharacterized protein n=1 Tax=Macleaya cordata TaxID=56857 RepID=A0A200PSB0_MACCD|nr:hypothetical protein BVC80_989g46 [Macleaya cordata]
MKGDEPEGCDEEEEPSVEGDGKFMKRLIYEKHKEKLNMDKETAYLMRYLEVMQGALIPAPIKLLPSYIGKKKSQVNQTTDIGVTAPDTGDSSVDLTIGFSGKSELFRVTLTTPGKEDGEIKLDPKLLRLGNIIMEDRGVDGGCSEEETAAEKPN